MKYRKVMAALVAGVVITSQCAAHVAPVFAAETVAVSTEADKESVPFVPSDDNVFGGGVQMNTR